MVSPRSLRWVALALGSAALLAVWLYPTDEKRVKEAAQALVTAANQSPGALSQALEANAVPDVRVSVAELSEPVSGRDALVAALVQAKELAPKLRFRIESVDVSLEGNRARLTADLITTWQPELPELRRPRHSAALFEKRAGRFRLVSAEIGPERLDQPEARP
jgi:hypothetical protein